jgi:hypothetical protein
VRGWQQLPSSRSVVGGSMGHDVSPLQDVAITLIGCQPQSTVVFAMDQHLYCLYWQGVVKQWSSPRGQQSSMANVLSLLLLCTQVMLCCCCWRCTGAGRCRAQGSSLCDDDDGGGQCSQPCSIPCGQGTHEVRQSVMQAGVLAAKFLLLAAEQCTQLMQQHIRGCCGGCPSGRPCAL